MDASFLKSVGGVLLCVATASVLLEWSGQRLGVLHRGKRELRRGRSSRSGPPPAHVPWLAIALVVGGLVGVLAEMIDGSGFVAVMQLLASAVIAVRLLAFAYLRLVAVAGVILYIVGGTAVFLLLGPAL